MPPPGLTANLTTLTNTLTPPSHLLQTPLVLRELPELCAVADRRQVLPQRGGLAQGDGEARGRGPVVRLGGLGKGQVLGTAAAPRGGERVRVRDERERGQGPAGRRRGGRGRSRGRGPGRRGPGGPLLLVDGHDSELRLAQDLYVLSLLAVLLVELGSV